MIQIISSNNIEKLNQITSRSQFDHQEVNTLVTNIMMDVKTNKNSALQKYMKLYDKVSLSDFSISKEEIQNAYNKVDPLLIEDLKKAKQNIYDYHLLQMPKPYELTKENIQLAQRITPIETVGMYVPGGSAAYPSTVLMNAVPAKIAGVKKLIMITPPTKDGQIKPSILVAASIAGVDEIYMIGGAQGIAALTYGTETIPKVDKIVGPGNIYVSIAKRIASGYIGIDMIAGPSEILIIADDKANPRFIAADLMGQAEHDSLASAICITTSSTLAKKIQTELTQQIKNMPRKDIIKEALQQYGAIIVVESLEEAANLSNKIAPEHLELSVENPRLLLPLITNAGAIFLGEYTPEPVGDYFAGTNHTLPTSQTARFQSPLGVHDFIKRTSIIEYNKTSLKQDADSIIRLANEEGLYAHANAVKVRLEGE